MDNKTLKAVLKKMTGCEVKVRTAAASRGDSIDVFLPKAVRHDSARRAAVVAEIARLTGRAPFLLDGGFRGDIGPGGVALPSFHIQPLYEEPNAQ